MLFCQSVERNLGRECFQVIWGPSSDLASDVLTAHAGRRWRLLYEHFRGGWNTISREDEPWPSTFSRISSSYLFRIISVSSFFLLWMDQTAIGKDAFEACKDILGADSQSVPRMRDALIWMHLPCLKCSGL